MTKSICSVMLAFVAVILASPALANQNHEAQQVPVDFAIVHTDEVSRSQPVRILEFDASTAHLGKGKHRDQALEMAESAPGILAGQILAGLHAKGFTDVAIFEEGDAPTINGLTIDGNFTVLNPGSTTKRVLWGFGAGKTQVCVRGSVLNATGESLAEFNHCRKGLGWGSAEPQIEPDTGKMGF